MSVALSIAALIISIAAATFTGWQALSTHASRQDARRVHLILIPNPRASAGAVVDEPNWMIENAGDGTAVNVRITITYTHGEIRTKWTTNLSTVVGRTRYVLDLDKAPVPTTRIAGSTETVGRYLTAHAAFSVPGGRRVRRQVVGFAAV